MLIKPVRAELVEACDRKLRDACASLNGSNKTIVLPAPSLMSNDFFWLYILKCADQSYYTGHTDSLDVRLAQHEAGAISNCYTATRRPVVLVYWAAFASREEALAAEIQVKGWSRRKKEAMMMGDWKMVSQLAMSKVKQ